MSGSSFSFNNSNMPLMVQSNGFSVPNPQYFEAVYIQPPPGPQMLFHHQNLRNVPPQANLRQPPPPTASQTIPFIHQATILQNQSMSVPPPMFTTPAGAPTHAHATNVAVPHHSLIRQEQQYIVGGLPPGVGVTPATALTSASYDENFQHVQSLDCGGGSSASSFPTYGAPPPVPTSDSVGAELHHHLPSSHENFRMHQMQPPPPLNSTTHAQTISAPMTILHATSFPHLSQNYHDRMVFIQQQSGGEQLPSFVGVDVQNVSNQAKIQPIEQSSTISPPNVVTSLSNGAHQNATVGNESVNPVENCVQLNSFYNALKAKPFVPQNQSSRTSPPFQGDQQRVEIMPLPQNSEASSDQTSVAPTPNQQSSQQQTPESDVNQQKLNSNSPSVNDVSSSWRRNTSSFHQKVDSNDSNISSGSRPERTTTPDVTKTTSTSYNKNQHRRHEVVICYFCKMNNKPEAYYTSHRTLTDDKVTCLALKETGCTICGATGDNAHPEIYCNEHVSSEEFNAFAKSFSDRNYVGKLNNNNTGHGHYNNHQQSYHNNGYNNNYYRGGNGGTGFRNSYNGGSSNGGGNRRN